MRSRRRCGHARNRRRSSSQRATARSCTSSRACAWRTSARTLAAGRNRPFRFPRMGGLAGEQRDLADRESGGAATKARGGGGLLGNAGCLRVGTRAWLGLLRDGPRRPRFPPGMRWAHLPTWTLAVMATKGTRPRVPSQHEMLHPRALPAAHVITFAVGCVAIILCLGKEAARIGVSRCCRRGGRGRSGRRARRVEHGRGRRVSSWLG
jgi:hypothetical protein